MRAFFERKGIRPGVNTYLIQALSYMALGLFSSLIIGLIMQTAGDAGVQAGLPLQWLADIGGIAMELAGPAIGVAVAYGLKAPRLVLFAAVFSGALGYDLAGPAGSFLAAVFSTEAGKVVSQETKVDIIVTPFTTIVAGALAAYTVGPPISGALAQLGAFIIWATEQQPFIMGIIIAVTMGLALTAPISSAAIAIILQLEGLAAGAATVGCTAQMVGFAVSSYRENKGAGLVALGLGTSMLQIANVVRNPRILLPPTITAAILGPFATMVFLMENNPEGAGMGTSGFVGQIMTFNTMGINTETVIGVIILHLAAPAVLSLLLSEWMRRKEWIKFGDMEIEKS
ncbi:PTS transporter subunit IIC [Alkalicoccus halolimnae]|uniref:PTS sugar transporter subunit IIC n=1 Tax=Alkalicoccus halolimnae TaxID=1667239 RepID=A0A5C7F2Z8_9BACI|nr:PTS sugar transporter subunit IIC [Alkalicoccus halolimnae]TXF81564.1 PTS sugar transporter subunit IIC [Alkalicoccus halolimnae]